MMRAMGCHSRLPCLQQPNAGDGRQQVSSPESQNFDLSSREFELLHLFSPLSGGGLLQTLRKIKPTRAHPPSRSSKGQQQHQQQQKRPSQLFFQLVCPLMGPPAFSCLTSLHQQHHIRTGEAPL